MYRKYSSNNATSSCDGLKEPALGPTSVFKKKIVNQFNINRPAYRSATTTIDKMGSVHLPQNERTGIGNRTIIRPNFISPPIKGREVLNFEKLQATDIEQSGIKVQLGDKTIEKLFKVYINDPTDVKWIEEKNRRLQAGETEEEIERNPPQGRPQRKVSKMTNFGAQGLSIQDKIEQLKSAIDQGHSESKTDMANVIAQTAQVLNNMNELRKLTTTGYNELKQLVNRLHVPKHWKGMGFEHRIYSLNQYRQEAGMINLFLLSNIPNINAPLNIVNENGNITGKTNLVNMVQNLSKTGNRPERYLDLQNRAIIPLNIAVELANSGVDGGQLDDKLPPSVPPYNGRWLPDVSIADTPQKTPSKPGLDPSAIPFEIPEEEEEEKKPLPVPVPIPPRAPRLVLDPRAQDFKREPIQREIDRMKGRLINYSNLDNQQLVAKYRQTLREFTTGST